MVYHNRYNKNNGFSLVEIVLVLGIMTFLISISDSLYTKVKSSNNLKIGTDNLVETIRYAENSSHLGKGNDNWGVKIFSSNVVIFKGVNYISRDTSFDLSLNFPSGVKASGNDEFIFNKLTGWPTNTGTIILTNNSGVTNISINEKGTITY